MPSEVESYIICRALARCPFSSVSLVRLTGATSVPWTISQTPATIRVTRHVDLKVE